MSLATAQGTALTILFNNLSQWPDRWDYMMLYDHLASIAQCYWHLITLAMHSQPVNLSQWPSWRLWCSILIYNQIAVESTIGNIWTVRQNHWKTTRFSTMLPLWFKYKKCKESGGQATQADTCSNVIWELPGRRELQGRLLSLHIELLEASFIF